MPWPPEFPPNRDVKDTLKTTGLPLRDESLEEMVMSGSEICRLLRLRLRNEPCFVLPLEVGRKLSKLSREAYANFQ